MTTKSNKNSDGNSNNRPQRRDSNTGRQRINEQGKQVNQRPAERQKSGNESFVSGRPPKEKK